MKSLLSRADDADAPPRPRGLRVRTLASVCSQQPDVGLLEGLTGADGAGFAQQAWKATVPWISRPSPLSWGQLLTNN